MGPLVLLVATLVLHGSRRWASAVFGAALVFNLATATLALLRVLIEGSERVVLWAPSGYGFDLQLDALSTTLVLLVAFVGALVGRFAAVSLAGERERGRFFADLCLTLAAVSVLLLAGNLLQLALGWIGASLGLHRLLTLQGRPEALAGARKKFVVARLGDGCLLTAAGLLIHELGTPVIAELGPRAQALEAAGTVSLPLQLAALLLVAAACFKSALLPTHGWLLDVIEAPTPVSALLHAGLINAGGFLIVRLAAVVVTSKVALTVLLLIGAATALFGSLVALTRTDIKSGLAYSTMAQMGFMLFQCGLGAFASAALHIVVHSLYKAHAFLASGSVVERARARSTSVGAARPVTAMAALGALVLATGLFVGAGWLLVSPGDKPGLLPLGVVMVLGLSQLLLRAWSDGLEARTLVLSAAVLTTFVLALSYFGLQLGAAAALAELVPAPRALGPLEIAATVLAVSGFAAAMAVQWLGPEGVGPRWQRLYVWLHGGLYIDAWLSRRPAGG